MIMSFEGSWILSNDIIAIASHFTKVHHQCIHCVLNYVWSCFMNKSVCKICEFNEWFICFCMCLIRIMNVTLARFTCVCLAVSK